MDSKLTINAKHSLTSLCCQKVLTPNICSLHLSKLMFLYHSSQFQHYVMDIHCVAEISRVLEASFIDDDHMQSFFYTRRWVNQSGGDDQLHFIFLSRPRSHLLIESEEMVPTYLYIFKKDLEERDLEVPPLKVISVR